MILRMDVTPSETGPTSGESASTLQKSAVLCKIASDGDRDGCGSSALRSDLPYVVSLPESRVRSAEGMRWVETHPANGDWALVTGNWPLRPQGRGSYADAPL